MNSMNREGVAYEDESGNHWGNGIYRIGAS